jgi:proteic killer suppression protein
MIRSFADKDTKKVFQRVRIRKLETKLQKIAQRKLVMIDAAEAIIDLKEPTRQQAGKVVREPQRTI